MSIRGRAEGASIGLSNISERFPNLDDMRMLWSFYCVLYNTFNLVWLSFLRHVQTPNLQETLEGTASTSHIKDGIFIILDFIWSVRSLPIPY